MRHPASCRARFESGIPALALALLFMGWPFPASPQTGPESAVARLAPGEVVRVQAPGLSVDQGTVSEVDDGTLYLLEGGQEWLIDVRSIERLERRHRTVGKNVLIYGGIGALAGFGAGKFNEDLSAVPFAVGGVAVGLVMGLTQWQWRPLYPR
ncbi:MAG: hypothetical protein R3304_07960 [Longimicrobiales bacterium]|nr:hypothetical protein [Longimicrobiales bacterium]